MTNLTKLKACSSENQDSPICKDGFRQSALCHGHVCSSCGQPIDAPMCLRDELPAHFIDDSGLPVLAEYRRAGLEMGLPAEA